MPRRFEFHTPPLGEGPLAQRVGFSSKRRGKFLAVVFIGPDGKRLQKATPCRKPDLDFEEEALRIIRQAYSSVYLDPKRVSWDEALTKIASDLRPDTLTAYTKAVRILRQTLEGEGIQPPSPIDISPQHAAIFSRVWLAGTFKRGKGKDAKRYKRKPTTLAFYLRQLSAVWEQWLLLGYVRENPWKGVRMPTTNKTRKLVPGEEDVTAFFTWVVSRYPQWERLHALLDLKALSGCRSQDICQLRSDQLRDGRVVWEADQTKHREDRAVLVPDELFQKLRRLAGPTYLWEGFIEDMEKYRPSKNRKTSGFAPKTVFWVMANIFREFGEKYPARKHLTPHSFRRRAITLVTTATQSIDATAQVIGVSAATARRYYLDAQRAFNTDEIMKKVAGTLLPKPKTDG